MSDDSAQTEPNLEQFYGNLRNYVKMVTEGYSNLLMLDAKGGLGKTWNVRKTLSKQCDGSLWFHQKGFTTPIELYKTLWKARNRGSILFLDDMSGITGNTKAIDMLKAATETDSEENWVQYRTSRDIDHPEMNDATLPNSFCFNGRVIISFNDTPSNHHFNALKDRGTYYNLSFDHSERIEIIKEIAKKSDFSSLSVPIQQDTANWIERVTNSSYDVTIRTFEEIIKMREFSKSQNNVDWKKMALEVFDIDYRKQRIIELRENNNKPVAKQVEQWCNEFDQSESTYYNLMSEIKDERSN